MPRSKPIDRAPLESQMTAASIELEKRFASGNSNVCESILADFPAITENRESVLELIYLEFVLREERGERQEISSYAGRFPEFFDDFVGLLDVDAAMRVSHSDSTESFAEAATEASTFHGRTSQQTAGPRSTPLRTWSGMVGDYFLLEILGTGGMGIVYRAHQSQLNRTVALKTLHSNANLDSATLANFRTEAELAARLQHSNIVQIYEVGTHSGTPYFSMELMGGGNLQDSTKERPLQPVVAAKVMLTIAQAVQYAHSQGIIHRDLKPANILLAPSDRSEAIELRPGEVEIDASSSHRVEIKIADFGLAKHLESHEQTQTGAAIGTPSYMAPEQINRELGTIGPTCDIYSMGAIFYSLLVGRPPFHAATILETLHQVGNDDPIAPRKIQSRVPRDLETVCLKCLRKEPHRRYGSAAELADDIQRFLDGKPIHGRSAGPAERSLKWVRRNPSLTALLVSVMVATLTITWMWRRAEKSSVVANEERIKAQHLVYARDISLAHFEYQSHHVERCQEILQNCKMESRNWEWNYLKSLCKEHVWESPNAGAPVLSLAMSPNGKYVAGSFGLWGIDQVEPVRVWDMESNKLLWELNGHSGCVHCVSFSPDGQSLLTSAVVWDSLERKKGTKGGVKVWDLASGLPRLEWNDVGAVASCFLPDGKSILVGTDSGIINQYDNSSGEKTQSFIGHQRTVLDLAINSQGNYFASTARDNSLRIWNFKTAKWVNSLGLQPVDPFQLDWSPNGKQLVVGGWGGDFLAYEVSNLNLRLMNKRKRSGLPVVKYSPDSQYLVTAVFSEGAELQDSQHNEVIQRFHGHNGNIRAVAFDGTGAKLVTGGADGCIRLWNLAEPMHALNRATTNGPCVAAMANNPVRREVALAPKFNAQRGDPSKQKPLIEIRDPNTLTLVKTFEGHTDWVTGIAYRNDGNQLLSGSIDKTVRVWEIESGKQQHVLLGHEHPIVGVAFLDRLERAISGDRDGHFKIWNLATGTIEKAWNMPGQKPSSICINNDRSVLAVGAESGAISILDVSDGRRLSYREGHERVQQVAFSPDGRLLAVTRDKTKDIEVWETSELLKPQRDPGPSKLLAGNVDAVNSVSFSPDSQRLVSSGRDESVRIYNPILGHELLNLHVVRGINNIVHFGPNSELLYSEEHRLYGLAPQKSLAPTPALYPSEKVAAVWHKREVESANLRENWFASIFHQRRIRELTTPTPELQYNLGVQHAYLGDYGNAEKELKASLELKDSPSTRSKLAMVRLRQSDFNGYQEQCQHLFASALKSESTRDINNAVWACSLADCSGVDANVVLEFFERQIAGLDGKSKLGGNVKATYANTLALANLRAKKYHSAIVHANESLEMGSVAPMADHAILAICYSKLNQLENAKKELGLAIWRSDNNRRLVEAGAKLSSTLRNLEAFEFPTLLKEAKELVQKATALQSNSANEVKSVH